MKRLAPVAVVACALALFGAGVGTLAALGGGNSRSQAPAVASAATVLPPSGKLPRDFFGIVSEDAFAHPGGYRAAVLNRLAGMGVGILRQTFDWAAIEPSPGRYDFTAYDDFVASLAARRMTVLPVLTDPPQFLSARPASGARRGTYPPRRYSDMGAFAALLARRYGPGGRFWRAHPELPAVPIRAWQVWNEPSLPVYWPSGPDPAQYARMLEATARAIRHVDPGAQIVTAGIPQSRLGIPFETFVNGMLAAGAARWFDTLAIHPYASDAGGVTAAVQTGRRLLDSSGDRRAGIWVTELGWADSGPPSSFTVSAAAQAHLIASALPALASLRSQVGLRGIVYFGWRDGAPYPPRYRDFWGLHTGLLDLNGRPKPAFRAFVRTVVTLRRHG